MLDLNLLTTFLDIARTGNLQATAKRLSITPSAASQRLKALETQIGKGLFLRMRTGMRLNENGRRLLSMCRDLNREAEAIDDWILTEQGRVAGDFTISSISTIITHIFPALLRNLLREYPDIGIAFRQNISAATEQEVLEGRSDFGIIAGPCKRPSLKVLRLFENNDVLMVASPNYFLAKKKAVTREDLAKAKIIWHGERESRTARRICAQLKIPFPKRFGSILMPNMEMCLGYVREGLGLCFIAKLAALREIQSGELVVLPGFELKIPINLIFRNEPFESAAFKILKEEIVTYCHALDRKI